MAKIWGNEKLVAADMNANIVQPGTSGSGNRMVAGKLTVNFSSQNNADATITYGFTFSSAPTLVGTVHVGSAFNLAVLWNTAPGTTAASAHIFQVAGTNITGTAILHWVAVGPA